MTSRWELAGQPEELIERYLRDGVWSNDTLGEVLTVAARKSSDTVIRDRDNELSYRQILKFADSFAAYLRDSGIGQGDIVAWQLPNWWEFLVVSLAVWRIGAVASPIASLYREREIAQALDMLQPAAVITCAQYRSTNHVETFESAIELSGQKPALRVVVRGMSPGWTSFDSLLSSPESLGQIQANDPDDPCVVVLTSGSSSAPKGVIHTSRSLVADFLQMTAARHLTRFDTFYMPAPLAHITGLVMGVIVPLALGARLILDDQWNAERAQAIIESESVTVCSASTLFVRELTEVAVTSGRTFSTLRSFACGGSTVSSELILAAHQVGIPALRGYGMSELPSLTTSDARDPMWILAETDGLIGRGVEVSIRDQEGREIPTGGAGEIWARGPERMAGYIDPAETAAAIDQDGWFRTGDLGTVRDGTVTVSGRIKEIINRGGEKFSAREVEDVLLTHESVVAVSVVPAPHPRFGEVPAAWIVADAPLDRATLQAFLETAGLTRQKIPAHWFFTDALPLTSLGKVRRGELIDWTRERIESNPPLNR